VVDRLRAGEQARAAHTPHQPGPHRLKARTGDPGPHRPGLPACEPDGQHDGQHDGQPGGSPAGRRGLPAKRRRSAKCWPGQVERFHVTAKLFPLLFSAPGWASTLLELSTIVISSSVNEEIVPEVDPAVTASLPAVQVLKWASG
jgi:hypothetical protein